MQLHVDLAATAIGSDVAGTVVQGFHAVQVELAGEGGALVISSAVEPLRSLLPADLIGG